MATEHIPDWDELMASGEIDATPEERMQARMRVLWREAEAAMFIDIEYTIEMATAASAMARGEAPPSPAAGRTRRGLNKSRAQLARRAREAAEAQGDLDAT